MENWKTSAAKLIHKTTVSSTPPPEKAVRKPTANYFRNTIPERFVSGYSWTCSKTPENQNTTKGANTYYLKSGSPPEF
jgi:hypothetical protein